jgi:hypothetical protein
MSFASEPIRVQTPASFLDYGFNWGTWPLAAGETLVSSVWSVDLVTVPPLVLSGEGMVDLTGTPTVSAGIRTVVWISGGLADADYLITNSITTSDARQFSQSFVLQVRAAVLA